MEDNTKYTASELLIQFLDNELDEKGELALNRALKNDPSLQSELSELTAISDSIKRDPELRMNPPADATEAVFNSLGFSSSFHNEKINISDAANKNNRRKKLIPLLTALLLSTVPLVYYSAFLDDKPSFNKNEKNTSSSNLNKKAIVDNAINQDNLLKKDIAPKSNSSALSYNNSGKANKSKISALSNNASKNENITSTDIISITAFNDEDNLFANNSASTLSKSSIFVSKELNIDQNNPEIRFINSRYINEPINRDWQFSIRYLAGANPAVQGFANNTGSILPINNIAIGAIMGAGSNFNILLEFGQEDFLRYSSDETDMLTLKERSAFWVATGLRYDLNSLSAAGIKPYGQLNLGASTEGFIIRGSAGMQFHDDDLKVMGLSPAIIIGYELTELIYKAPDNKYYAPYKHGLTLGLNFHF